MRPIAEQADVAILDVGSGRAPTLAPRQRVPGCRYVGLDLSAHELECAGPSGYDETVVGDAAASMPQLVGRFDLVISFYVFEHIRVLDVALEHMRSYLQPGGRLVAVFSGTFSAFGLINRVLPHAVGATLVSKLRQRPRETIFPAYYSGCYYSALARTLAPWSEWSILPLWRGADYFAFSRPVEAVYLAYEEWAMRTDRRDLAPYYLICATR